MQANRLALGETMIAYQTAMELYKEALNIDPEFALAWIGLAKANIIYYWSSVGDPIDRDKARQAIEKARAINSSFAELFMVEGFYWYWGHLDYERALYHLGKAIQQMPGNDEAHMGYAYVSRRIGHWEQAIKSMRLALRVNPRVAFNWIELGATYNYLHRYPEARRAYEEALRISPDAFWSKTSLGYFEILESGNVKAAIKLTAGAQHTNEVFFIDVYLLTRIFAGRYEEALEVTRKLSDDMEIQLQAISLREDRAAQILLFMGREEEAATAARAGLFRLKVLSNELGDDYRIDLAEARLNALQGASPVEIRAAIAKAISSSPADAILEFYNQYEHARIYAIAGMTSDSIASLEPLFSPPSGISVPWVELDPVFNGIREEPEFMAMMERHR
jgi:Tfp pilus assembly protein PilF